MKRLIYVFCAFMCFCFLGFSLDLLTPVAHACSRGPTTLEEDFLGASSIFTATVTKIDIFSQSQKTISIDTKKVLKGDSPSFVFTNTDSDRCGAGLMEGKTYLFYSHGTEMPYVSVFDAHAIDDQTAEKLIQWLLERTDSGFKDVTDNHWGYESITWANAQGIIDGYPDGTFKPDQSVGQTEFLAMLIRAYKPKDFVEDLPDGDWTTPYRQYAAKMGWGGSYIVPPSSKSTSSPAPEILAPRMYIAKLITNANGRNYGFEDSIRYLLDLGIAQGKTDKSVEGFEGRDLLTRAEAVTFIKNLKSKLDMLYPSPARTEQMYDPKTMNLTPFEVFPLYVNEPPSEKTTRFSHVAFEYPSAGYTLIHEPTYTIKGTVYKAVGEHLTIAVEYWDSGFFKSLMNVKAIMDKGNVSTSIVLPKAGIYRMTIFSKYENVSQDIDLTTFYLEYKASGATPNDQSPLSKKLSLDSDFLQTIAKGMIPGVEFGIGASKEDVFDKWGEPHKTGTRQTHYDAWFDYHFFFSGPADTVGAILVSDNTIRYTVENIKKALGTPSYEGNSLVEDGWEINYTSGEYVLFFMADKQDGTVRSMLLKKR